VDTATFTAKDDLQKAVMESIETFKSAGGVFLLMYSLVTTRTFDAVKMDQTRS
jgi:hypothetical protein